MKRPLLLDYPSFDDREMIRAELVESLRKCGKTRKEIADRITQLSGRHVTERMLNCYCASSKDDYKFPCELVRAFCKATDDNRLSLAFLAATGLSTISAEQRLILDLGERQLAAAENARQIAELKKSLTRRKP